MTEYSGSAEYRLMSNNQWGVLRKRGSVMEKHRRAEERRKAQDLRVTGKK